jgi:hypothetical protein
MAEQTIHPLGKPEPKTLIPYAEPVREETFGGRFHMEWDRQASVTAMGQLPFFIEFLHFSGLFGDWVSRCPLRWVSPNAPNKRNVLGTVLLSVLSGYTPGRPSPTYHTYMIANLRLILDVEVQSGKQVSSKHSSPGLWVLLNRLPLENWSALLKGDRDWDAEANL